MDLRFDMSQTRTPFRRALVWLSAAAGCAATLTVTTAAASTPTPSPAPLPPSAIGNANAIWIQVSPAYKTTGLVIASGSQMSGCSGTACNHVYVSHDGGNSWGTAAATGWNGGRPVISVDASGHESLYSVGNASTQRSDDGGQTWKDVGNGGYMPQVEPTYAHDGAVAIAGPHDFVLKGSTATAVPGSGGSASADYQFFFAPGYPSTGKNAPVLLSGLNAQSKPLILKCTTALSCSGGATLANEQASQTPSFTSLGFSGAYASDGVVFAQANRDLYKSSDGGTTFVPLAIAPADGSTVTTTPMMALAPGFRDAGPVRTLYAAVFEVFLDKQNPHTGGNVYESDDAGTTWHPIATGTPLGSGANAVTVAPDGRLFASYLEEAGGHAAAGLLCSTDGKTWVASCPAVGVAPRHATGPSSAGGSSGGAAAGAGAGRAAATAPAAGQAPGGASGQGRDGQVPTGTSVPGTTAQGDGMGWRTTTGIVALVAVVLLGLASLIMRRRERRSSTPSPETGEGSL